MSNRTSRRSTFTSRPPSDSSSSEEDVKAANPRKRKANVYDAVAGRVTQGGFAGNSTDIKASKQPLRPDEVLFKQPNAPTRYEETDYYFAYENLPAGQQLPSGDMLSAIHAYVSKLYSKTAEPGTEKAWKCMDETALIAFGILMEETARAKLGETGDLAFTEAADSHEEDASDDSDEGDESSAAEKIASRSRASGSVLTSGTSSNDSE